MKKLGLLSVATAVAIAGLSTSAFAKPAEEAIKDVDVSGYVRYRFTNDAGLKNSGVADAKDVKSSSQHHRYRTVLGIKSKVNDSVTAKIQFDAAVNAADPQLSDSTGDLDPEVARLTEANFIMNLGGNTVIAGKQTLQTPFADPADQQGTGVVALFPVMDGLTLAGGWYANHDGKSIYGAPKDIKGNNITALAALGAAGGFNYGLWYAMISEDQIVADDNHAAAGAAAMNINLKGKVAGIGLEVNHASVAYSLNESAKAVVQGINANSKGNEALTATQSRVVVSGKFGDTGVAVGMVQTGDDSGDVTLGDADGKANFQVENMEAHKLAGASITYVGVDTKVAGLGVGLQYASGSGVVGLGGKTWNKAEKDTDVKETKLSVAYKMSKNFKISGYHAMLTQEQEKKKDNKDQTRLELKYTF